MLFLLAVHGATLAAVAASRMDWFWAAALWLLVIGSFVNAVLAHVRFSAPWAVREAMWESDGTWTLTLASGKSVESQLLAPVFVAPGLTVLNFAHGRLASCSMVLLADSLEADLLRRLRARLWLRGVGDSHQDDLK